MTPERWQRIQEIFAAALDQPVDARSRYVADACGGDEELAAEVTSLLQSADSAGDYFARLAQGAGVPTVNDTEVEQVAGRAIGPYRLVRILGRGGMGVVYLAERGDQQFEMQTALKLLPLGMDTEESRHRFFLERQILARLQHPGIARLLDGGMTDDGTPYYVMEHVEGTPIDEYCDAQRLSIPERLEVFLRVCDAVQHAHRNLVVHRDLKPTNILVTAAGEVKLLDFGIARLLDQEGATAETFTQRAHPMTLAYASPEQVRGEPITTATDVYALGILLYRLLTGHHPYVVSFSTPAEAERTICGEEPTRPSVRIRHETRAPHDGDGVPITPAALADARGTTAPRLGRVLAGDLDTIVLTALRKEPVRRYPSVSHLAEDVRHFQAGLPVSAREDTFRYRASRFVKRNRLAVATAGLFAILVLALVGLAVRYAVTTAAQSRRIAEEARKRELVSAAFVDLFRTDEPVGGFGDTVRVRTILEHGVERVDAAFGGQPEIRARMMGVLARVYANLGLYDEAVALHDTALAALRALHPADELAVADELEQLATAHVGRRSFEVARQSYAAALSLRRRLRDDPLRVAVTLEGLAATLRELERADSAEALLEEVLAIRRARLGAGHYATLEASLNLGAALRTRNQLDSAESVYRTIIPQLRALGDSGARLLANALNNLAFLETSRGRDAEAERLYREALPLERAWGVAPNVIVVLNNLASALDRQGKLREAEAALLEAMRVAEERWPEGHWRIGAMYAGLADLTLRMGDTATAASYQRRRVEVYERTLGPDHGWTIGARGALGSYLTLLRRFTEAEALLLDGYATLRARVGLEDRYTQEALARLVALYEAWGKPDQAARYGRLRTASPATP